MSKRLKLLVWKCGRWAGTVGFMGQLDVSQLMAVVMGQVGISSEHQKNGNKQFTSVVVQEPGWKPVERGKKYDQAAN